MSGGREVTVLALSSTVLLGGLTLWWFFERDRVVPDAELLASVRAPQPPIGAPLTIDERRDAALVATLSDLGTFELVTLFRVGEDEVRAVVVPGAQARATFEALARARDTLGASPVILGNGASVERLVRDAALDGAAPAAIIRRAATLSVPVMDDERVDGIGEPMPPHGVLALVDPVFGLPWPQIAVALIPTAPNAGPGAPLAWLDFGNWRGCPDAATHVVTVDLLAARYGARLIAVGSDSIELEVTAELSEAQRLDAARILAAYAPALLVREDGSRRSVAGLAAEVLHQPVWSLRWPRP